VDGGLLIELFTHHGIGTMIVPEIPETIRPAGREHIPGILQILEPLEQQGILVRRTSEELERDIDHFFVIEADVNILGTAAIYPFPEGATASWLPSRSILSIGMAAAASGCSRSRRARRSPRA